MIDSRESFEEQMAAGRSFDGLELRDLDISGMELADLSFAGARLLRCRAVGTRLIQNAVQILHRCRVLRAPPKPTDTGEIGNRSGLDRQNNQRLTKRR